MLCACAQRSLRLCVPVCVRQFARIPPGFVQTQWRGGSLQILVEHVNPVREQRKRQDDMIFLLQGSPEAPGTMRLQRRATLAASMRISSLVHISLQARHGSPRRTARTRGW